jgi:adenylate cyclase
MRSSPPPVEVDSDGVRRQLERLLGSSGFARNERLSAFLRFIVEQHLEGKDEELKESVIGVEIFGRPPDYNPKRDSIVRTEAARLRARLGEYYANGGRNDELVIDLPKGGYVPVIRRVQKSADTTALATPRSRKSLWLVLMLGCLATGLAVVAWNYFFQRQASPISIAVLPLTSLSENSADDYFVDGLTNEIIRNLSIIDGLAVRSQTSAFSFKGKPRDIREAGKQLDVDYILEGSVLRAGQQLRINAQLVRVRDDFPIWSGRYDRQLPDVLAIQDDISRSIVNGLRLKLGRGRRRYETNAEAYDLYLRGRSFYPFGGHVAESISAFERAIAMDSSFAPAYAGLAGAYAFQSGVFNDDRADDLAKMRAAAERAIQLDPLLAEAHDALGVALARDGQWEQSEKSFRRSIEIDPSSSITRVDYAMYLLLPLGRIDEAVHQDRAAEKADPLSSSVQRELVYALMSAGQYDEAERHCTKTHGVECLGRVRIAQGRFDDAIQILASDSNPRYYGHALGRAGRREEAERLTTTTARNPFQQALIFAGLGDKDRTLEALDRMTVQGPVRIGRDLTYPEFNLIRGDPRLKALRKNVGLPE